MLSLFKTELLKVQDVEQLLSGFEKTAGRLMLPHFVIKCIAVFFKAKLLSVQDIEQLLRLHPAAGWSMPPQVTDVFTEYSIVIFVIKCNAVMFKAKLKKCETYLAAGWSILPQVTDVGLAAILEHSAAYIWCTKSMHQIFVLFFFLFWPQIKEYWNTAARNSDAECRCASDPCASFFSHLLNCAKIEREKYWNTAFLSFFSPLLNCAKIEGAIYWSAAFLTLPCATLNAHHPVMWFAEEKVRMEVKCLSRGGDGNNQQCETQCFRDTSVSLIWMFDCNKIIILWCGLRKEKWGGQIPR